MVAASIEEFFYEFRQENLAGAEANKAFLESEFFVSVAKELEDSGVIDGFDECHYKAPRGMKVDGYWFKEDEPVIDLFIVDFSNRENLESLTKTEVNNIFKKLENFFVSSATKNLHESLEETSPGYGLARDVSAKRQLIAKVNFYLFSERILSERIIALENKQFQDWRFSYQVWDVSRFHKMRTSSQTKEELVIDFEDMFDRKIQCLPAHIDTADYQSFLLVMPGEILSDLYEQYGSRLLEQNVRCFLQARGKVNKGIRATIMTDPEMFFAFNNGITATAREVVTDLNGDGMYIKTIKDLQIVNGGQTTASLFHTHLKDKADLEKVFVQVKLSVVDSDKSEDVVQKISEYANTQNKVNAADFFSNHPFHIRMEEFSRRILAPAKQSASIDTKWFYERARGQYADAQAKLTKAEIKRFRAQYPKPQMFTKTDMAKYENVWDENPIYVNCGAQKSFAQYAGRIGKEWDKNPDQFNEYYYKRIISRSIIFKRTEKIISAQSWYSGGYRANIVAYTLALLSEFCEKSNKSIDYINIWDNQEISDSFLKTISAVGKIVHDDILSPPAGISNISEWCKKEGCWRRLQDKLSEIKSVVNDGFSEELVDKAMLGEEVRSASQVQVIDDGILAQKKVMEIPGKSWLKLYDEGKQRGIFSPKDLGILQIASQIPNKIPTERQSIILVSLLEKAKLEGIVI